MSAEIETAVQPTQQPVTKPVVEKKLVGMYKLKPNQTCALSLIMLLFFLLLFS